MGVANAKLNLSDTAGMMNAYRLKDIAHDGNLLLKLNLGDSASMLNAYRLKDISHDGSLLLKVNFTDTSAAFNVYRLKDISHDASVSSLNADTATLAVRFANVLAVANTKMGISDTSSMLSLYARDYNVVHKTGTETIAGAKEFSTVPTSGGNAFVLTNDSRMTNSRNAADVYTWAKQATKPSYDYSELSGTPSIPVVYTWALQATKPSYTYAEIGGSVPTWNQNTTGNAATATLAANSTLWNGYAVNLVTYGTSAGDFLNYDNSLGIIKPFSTAQIQTKLGLGTYAYRSSGLAELTGAAFTGASTFNINQNSTWAGIFQNSGSTDANGLYVNVGAASTGVPLRVDVNGSMKFQISNNGNAIFNGNLETQGVNRFNVNAHDVGTNYSLELYSTNQGSKEISIRFHESSQWYKQIRATATAFYFTGGGDLQYYPIFSGQGNFNLNGKSIVASSSTSEGGAGIFIQGSAANKNWFIGNQYNVNAALEFTPTASGGGTTIGTSPKMILTDAGNLTLGSTSGTGTGTFYAGLGNFSGALTGTTAAFNGVGINATPTSGGTSPLNIRFLSTGSDFYVGTESSTAGSFFGGSSAYASVFYSGQPIQSIISGTKRLEVNASGISVTGTGVFSAGVTMTSLTATTGYFSSTSASTSTSTGAVVIGGGLGVGGAFNLGGIIKQGTGSTFKFGNVSASGVLSGTGDTNNIPIEIDGVTYYIQLYTATN